ncbi:MAG: NADP-dependent malic enzyme [Candidatus Cloacimonetes bacterium]|nr:NADP-dependent malic enzyme [Candidatus Cloacimonadota bacterium]
MKLDLTNIEQMFPADFSEEESAKAKTVFLKKLSESAHKFYNGKIQTAPKAGIYGFNWFNVWYTPGVSQVSTTIRDDESTSFELSNRGNTVAIVSDSTRVLGDGDVGPSGGLGVMEGKAFLMKYLGGVDAVPLCVNSRNREGKNDPDKIIEFVKMIEPSFGAINLEDISQPNCYKVLDTLREECQIPVWHDDAQGTASVTLAGLLSALKITGRDIGATKIVLLGAGASNSTIARILMLKGANPDKMIIFDSKGSLHKNRMDVKADLRYYRKWELCLATNPHQIEGIETALKDADVLIALSQPGPDTIKPEWIQSMKDKSIVFACANPVPEIYPYKAKEAGAFIIATGRGDFPNQVNNSLGFPAILKGALLVRARKITDEMAIVAAEALSEYAVKRGLRQDYIIPTMDEIEVFPVVAAAVAMQAIKQGVARMEIDYDTILQTVKKDINNARRMTNVLMDSEVIKTPPEKMLNDAMAYAIKTIRG